MRKYLFRTIVLCVVVFLTGCLADRGVPAGSVEIQKDSFYVVFDKKFKQEDARKASVTGVLPGKNRPLS